ncbi:MAG: class F sortase [Thermomicrobium sp.]|nr:class F sortase [Thermomicrobium sp.]MDW7982686.1 class F sortase [Thermomicrobium sp.]
MRHPEPSSFAAPVFDPPQTLTVPSLGIVASVVPVGVDPSGVLALTADPSVVFWYEASGYPGLIGRMVLAGHLDSRDGSTGIFAQLARVQVGEEFEVTTARGARYRYRVTGLTRIEASDIARALSAPAIESEALLVTCDGRWDPRLGRYSHNLLVRGVLVPLQGDDAP